MVVPIKVSLFRESVQHGYCVEEIEFREIRYRQGIAVVKEYLDKAVLINDGCDIIVQVCQHPLSPLEKVSSVNTIEQSPYKQVRFGYSQLLNNASELNVLCVNRTYRVLAFC